jgi:hypothetical protein
MPETWLAKLNALETRIIKARKSTEATTWIRLREELERIAPRPKGELKSPPSVQENPMEPASIFDERLFWDEMRAEIEALRLRIRAEVEAYRSRNPAAGPYPPEQSRARAVLPDMG